MKWPWSKPEVRASSSYTDQVVSRLVAASAGVGDGGALAALETASKWWGLGLSSASVKPATLRSLRSRLRYLTPLAVRFADPVNRSM